MRHPRLSSTTFLVAAAFVIAGALAPVTVSLERDYAVYVEPNVWVRHAL